MKINTTFRDWRWLLPDASAVVLGLSDTFAAATSKFDVVATALAKTGAGVYLLSDGSTIINGAASLVPAVIDMAAAG